MGLESKTPLEAHLSNAEKQTIDNAMENSFLLPGSTNELIFIVQIADLVSAQDDEIDNFLFEPSFHNARHYKERLQKNFSSSAVDYALSKSDPTLVQEFDALIDIIRSRGEHILRNRDKELADNLLDRYKKLVSRIAR